MPYLHMQIGKRVTEEEKCALYQEICQIITLLPEKTQDNCMVRIEDGCRISMRGAVGGFVFAEIRLFQPSPEAAKRDFVRALSDASTRVLGVAKSDMYMNILEMPTWCVGGEMKS